jgi:hypothetical protein
MATRFNPYTLRWEDVGPGSVRAVDTALGQLAVPDEVAPGDLVVGKDPRRPYGKPMLGTTDKVAIPEVNPAPSKLGSAQNAISLVPPQELTPEERARAAAIERVMGLDRPPGQLSAPDADLEGPPAAEAAPAAPAKKSGGGGGGGGGAPRTPGQLTAQETIAQGEAQTAEDEQIAAMRAKGGVDVQQANAEAKLAEDQEKEAKAAKDAWEKKRAAAESHLEERETAASKRKVREIFEGEPLKALLAALATGIGARAAAITGTENTAGRIVESAATAYREKQQIEYEREMSGIKNEQDRLQFARMQAAADEAGLYRRFEMDRTKLLKTYGASKAQVDNDALIADFRAKQADRKEQRAKDLYQRGQNEVLQAAQVAQARAGAAHASAEAAKTRAETEAIAAGGGRPIGHVERVAAEQATESANRMAAAADLITRNPKAWAEYQRAAREQKEADALAESKFGANPAALARYFGQAPLAMEQRLKSPEAREIHSALAPVIAAKAREMDPVGVLNQESLRAGADRLGIITRKPDEITREIKGFETRFRGQASANLGTSAYQPPAAAANAPAAPQPLSDGELSRQIAGAQIWLRDHPDDEEVRGKVRALIAQRQRGG